MAADDETTTALATIGREESALARPAELGTVSAALAAQAKAQVEAAYVMAWRNPRDEDVSRRRLLKTCSRPRFAEVAEYERPIGGKRIRGASIRFAEACARAMGNIRSGSMLVHEDAEQRIFRVYAADLEANHVEERDVVVTKVVERKAVPKGVKPIGQRENSQGEMVYLVPADEHALTAKEGALISKALRSCILRLVPDDLVVEGLEAARATLRNRDAKDPDAARKALIDAFDGLGVSPSALRDYLGHELPQTVPAELQELRLLYAALREGEITWQAALEQKRLERGEGSEAKSPRDKVKDALKDK